MLSDLFRQLKILFTELKLVKTILTELTIYVQTKQTSWDHYLPFVLHSGMKYLQLSN